MSKRKKAPEDITDAQATRDYNDVLVPADDPDGLFDRREHAKASQRPSDDELAERTEDERVDTGLDAFNPDEVPPAEEPFDPNEVPKE
jgi:hypothetical protein